VIALSDFTHVCVVYIKLVLHGLLSSGWIDVEDKEGSDKRVEEDNISGVVKAVSRL
jgi:hypothetical protein